MANVVLNEAVEGDLAFFGVNMEALGATASVALGAHMAATETRAFGGACTAVAVAALERSTGQPPVWITVQFLSSELGTGNIRLVVDRAVEGRHVTQASVQAFTDDRVMFVALGAVRPAAAAGRPAAQFAVFPEVVGPAGAAAIDRPWPKVLPRHACWGAIELRSATANDRPTGSRLALWARVRGRPVERPATLAFLADLLPLALYWSTGERGRSLDNTIRFMATAPTEWVLLDVCPVSVADGFAHGTVNCWSQDGTLLASASQTLRLG